MITMDLHPTEQELILRIRNKFRYGEIRVETRDGLPYRIGQSISYERLDMPSFTLSTDDIDG